MNNCCNQEIYPDMEMRKWEVSCSTPLVPASNFYTKNEIDEMLEDIEISGGCNCDLDDYATKDEVTAGLATKLDASAYTPTDLSDYYTKEQVDASLSGKADVSDIPSLSGYATEQWVENKGYLTQHQPIKTINGISMVGEGNVEIGTGGTVDLSDYWTSAQTQSAIASAVSPINSSLTAHTTNGDIHVTQQEKSVWNAKLDASAYTPTDLSQYWTSAQTQNAINTSVSGKADIGDIPSLSGYATEQWVQNQGYLTQHQSLSEYYTKQETDSKLNGKLDASAYTPSDLSNYYNKQETDNLLNNKLDASAYTPTDLSNYWTSAQTSAAINASVSGKADASTVATHTSNTNIHVTSTEKSHWNTAYNNYFDRNNIWCGSESDFNTATSGGTNINPNVIYFIHQ